MSTVISDRKLKRYQAAEQVAKAFRHAVTTPHWMENERQMAHQRALDWTIYWLELAGADRYMLPPNTPKRWKANRDKSMGVPT